MDHTFYMPSRLFFGSGSLNKLATEVLPGKKALIVTGGTATTKYGYLARVEKLLADRGVEYVTYKGVQPNPTTDNVMEGASFARENNCDFVIGLGGGSSIDAAKSVALMATNSGTYWDYVINGSGKGIAPSNKPLPLIAITTTAGTGTEADPFTVITDENLREKCGYAHPNLFPIFSIIDVDLMMSIPKKYTAYQGFDALFHSLEGYIANNATPISDMFALKVIELIGKYIVTAVQDGSNVEARENMALANTLSGFVECTSGCTSEHSLEHGLSGAHPEIVHGEGLLMICLEYYKEFLDVCPEKFIEMAIALGAKDATKAEDFITRMEYLMKACDVYGLKMSDYGIKKENLKDYVGLAYQSMGGLFNRDRKVLGPDGALAILEKSYK